MPDHTVHCKRLNTRIHVKERELKCIHLEDSLCSFGTPVKAFRQPCRLQTRIQEYARTFSCKQHSEYTSQDYLLERHNP
jgi:hypothetical protein